MSPYDSPAFLVGLLLVIAIVAGAGGYLKWAEGADLRRIEAARRAGRVGFPVTPTKKPRA